MNEMFDLSYIMILKTTKINSNKQAWKFDRCRGTRLIEVEVLLGILNIKLTVKWKYQLPVKNNLKDHHNSCFNVLIATHKIRISRGIIIRNKNYATRKPNPMCYNKFPYSMHIRMKTARSILYSQNVRLHFTNSQI